MANDTSDTNPAATQQSDEPQGPRASEIPSGDHPLEEAARRLKPEAKRIILRAATLNDEAAVRAWLEEHEKKLLDAVAKGPVIVG